MTASSSSQTVLVTGVSGFVGAHVAKAFLDHGWEVVGTVRTTKQGVALLSLPAFSQAGKDGKFRFTVIEDIGTADFGHVLKGIDALAHTASPFHFRGKVFADYADPAIQGTHNLLDSARHFEQIKAVVVTSSFASVVDHSTAPEEQGGRVYTESDWLSMSYEDAQKRQDVGIWYRASKKLAEEKAWQVKKNGAPWSLATICPPMIFGPVIHTEKLECLNESSSRLYKLFSGQTQGQIPLTHFPAVSDVRDVAEAHYQVIARRAEGRFLVASGEYDNQRIADMIRDKFPGNSARVAMGQPGKHYRPGDVYIVDSSKAKQELGLKLKTFDQIIGDTIRQYITLEAQSS